jgi:Na+/H+ antiporter NhaB
MRARASPPLPPYQKGKPSAFLCLLLLSLFMAAGVSAMQQVWFDSATARLCINFRGRIHLDFVGAADAGFLRNFVVIMVWR